MTFNPVPKNPFKKSKPTRKQRGAFSKKTRDAILERDNHSCRVCKHPAEQIHHVKFRSQGGRGVYENGLSLCSVCHEIIHMDKKKDKYWKRQFEIMYGSDYYKDEWDE